MGGGVGEDEDGEGERGVDSVGRGAEGAEEDGEVTELWEEEKDESVGNGCEGGAIGLGLCV